MESKDCGGGGGGLGSPCEHTPVNMLNVSYCVHCYGSSVTDSRCVNDNLISCSNTGVQNRITCNSSQDNLFNSGRDNLLPIDISSEISSEDDSIYSSSGADTSSDNSDFNTSDDSVNLDDSDSSSSSENSFNHNYMHTPYSENLTCLYMNAQSIINKRNELSIWVEFHDPDVIAITETWAFPDILDAELSIPNYKIFRQDRMDTHQGRGGGVIMFVKDILGPTEVIVQAAEDFTNSVFCEIVLDCNTSLLIACIYRSPNSTVENTNKLYSILRELSDRHILILGDFNFPSIDWSMQSASVHDMQFLDLLNDLFLYQHVNFPTREDNILDLVITNEPDMVTHIQSIGKLGLCDHDAILCNVQSKVSVEESNMSFPVYHKADLAGMKDKLNSMDWCSDLEKRPAEECWKCVKDVITKLESEFVPHRTRNTKSKPMWMTRKAIRAVRKKQKLWKKYRLSQSNVDKIRYTEQAHKCKYELKNAKRNFEEKLADNIKSDSKSFFKYIRANSKTKDSVGPLKDVAGKIVSSNEDMTEELNGFFSSVFTNENINNIPEPQSIFHGDSECEMNDCVIDTEDVEVKLRRLEPFKAMGPDMISSYMLKHLSLELARPLSILFNKCTTENYVPDDWKCANVTPIFKRKGARSQSCNYRPVSLTSQVCKLFESLLKDRIVYHLDTHKLVNQSQHGFMKGKSCLTNLLEFLEDVTDKIDKGEPVDVIYLDFAKAFDKVPKHRLIAKIKAHGVNGSIAKWIEEWLTGRKQRVVLKGTKSSWSDVLSGVPQGSVLGPLLFIIFINDIDMNVSCHIKKFADDCKIYREVSSMDNINLLQTDINNLCKWSSDWQMLFNASKCSVVHMGYNNVKSNYSMNGTNLKASTHERDLGVIVSDDLKSTLNCVESVKKANRILGCIRRSITTKRKDIISKLYKQLVRPLLEYAVQSWNPYLQKDIVMIEKVQRRATKIIPQLHDLPYPERLKSLKLTTLHLRRHRGDMLEVFKILTGREGINENYLFERNIENDMNLRGHIHKLKVKQCRLNCRKYFFSQRIVHSWNELPEEVVTAPSINSFKNRFDKHLKKTTGVIMDTIPLIPNPRRCDRTVV